MSGLNWRTVVAAAIAASAVLITSAGAQARDGDRWDHRDRDHRKHWKHDRHHHHSGPERHWRRHEPRVVYERSRPVYERHHVYERPVMMMPAPVYQQAPMYQPQDPSLNFNFTVPLR